MPTTLLLAPPDLQTFLRPCFVNAHHSSIALMLLIVIHTCLLLDDNYFDLPQLCRKIRLKLTAFVPYLRRNFSTLCNILVSSESMHVSM